MSTESRVIGEGDEIDRSVINGARWHTSNGSTAPLCVLCRIWVHRLVVRIIWRLSTRLGASSGSRC